jgi:hypothetical protein
MHTLDDLSITAIGSRLSGDVNGSGVIDLSDAVYTLNYLFLRGPKPVSIVEAASKRFHDNGDGTVTDGDTGLMWQLDTAPGTFIWQDGAIYCSNLQLGATMTGGFQRSGSFGASSIPGVKTQPLIQCSLRCRGCIGHQRPVCTMKVSAASGTSTSWAAPSTPRARASSPMSVPCVADHDPWVI